MVNSRIDYLARAGSVCHRTVDLRVKAELTPIVYKTRGSIDMSDYSNGLKIGNRITADQAVQDVSTTGLGAIDVETNLITDPQSFNLDPYAGLGTFRGKTIAPLTGSFSVTSHIDTGLSLAIPANGVITYGFFDRQPCGGPEQQSRFGEGKGYSRLQRLQKTARHQRDGLVGRPREA